MPSKHGRGRTLAAHARKPSPSLVRVKVDRKRLDRWKALRAQLDARKREEAEGYDAYWEAVGEILDAQLYVDGGFETADAFVREVIKEPMRTVARHVRVAKYASPVDEARFGVAVIDAAIAYLEAKLGAPLRERLPFPLATLRVEMEQEGKTHRLGLDELSVEQLRAATKALTKARGKTRVVRSPSHEAITRALEGVASLKDIRVQVRDGFVDFRGVPLHSVHDLVSALRGVELPAEAGVAARAKLVKARTGAKRRAG
jgi:hypothetical protein